MPRNLQEISKLVQAKQNRAKLAEAVNHQNRLRLHSETSLEEHTTAGLNLFLGWVKTLLPTEKYDMFKHLLQFPVITNELVGEIYGQLYRVFTGRDKSFTYEFTEKTHEEDWEDYRQKKLGEPDVWEEEAWDHLKTSINSLLVVDLDREVTGRAEPYFYFLDISNVVGMEGDPIEWIAFEQEDGLIAFFDNEQRMLLELTENGEYTQVHQANHTLGYTPVRFFWSERVRHDNGFNRKSPVTKQLSKLDWLLFFEISKHHLDLYAPYPIYSAYEQDCDFEDTQTGQYCDAGFLRNENGYVREGHTLMKCPVCQKNRLTGVGSFITVPPPSEGVDMRKPVDITPPDINSLEYNVQEVKRLKDEIYHHAVGRGNELFAEAVNEMQVASGFESKTTILLKLKKNFEAAQEWVTKTVCKERYGAAFKSVSINYGTEFYVYTLKDLYDKYTESKQNGATDIVLDAIQEKIIELEFINNPLSLQRAFTLIHLEPYRHLSKDRVLAFYEKGIIDDTATVKLKLNFSSYIQRFEREQTSILEFANEKEFDDKIRAINEILLSYGETDTGQQDTDEQGSDTELPAERE